MKLLREITPEDIGIKQNGKVDFMKREAARAVTFGVDGKVALLNVSKSSYHKIPGGGIEEGENIELALQREIQEEVGARVKITDEVGEIIEKKIYEDGHGLIQKSYCYIGEIIPELKSPEYTDDEANLGFKLVWTDLDEAIKILETDKPLDYQGKYIQIRDLTFLKEAKKIVGQR